MINISACSTEEFHQKRVLFRGYLRVDDRLLIQKSAQDHFHEQLKKKSLPDLLENLNGGFFFIVKNGPRIAFGIDHYGGRNLFYRLTPGFALFDDPTQYDHRPGFSDEAFCCLLSAGFTTADETVYGSIFECDPGVLYEYDTTTEKLKTTTWYKYDSVFENLCDPIELNRIFLNALPSLPENFKYAVPLSGGLDSRALVAGLYRQRRPLQIFGYGFEESADYRISTHICQQLNLERRGYPITVASKRKWFRPTEYQKLVAAGFKGRSLPDESDWTATQEVVDPGHILAPGHTGDWLTGGQINTRLINVKNDNQLVDYVLDYHFGLTAFSSRDYRRILREKIRHSLDRINNAGGDLIALAERWNLEHRQRKFIINSAHKYTYFGGQIYLPFYDRPLLEFFRTLKLSEKIQQRGYIQFLQDALFVHDRHCLQTIPTTRIKWQQPFSDDFSRLTGKHKIHQMIAQYDLRKWRKKYLIKSHPAYDKACFLLSDQSPVDFLKQPVHRAFPLLRDCPGELSARQCFYAANHVTWLLQQRVAQMNVNGLYLCTYLPYMLGLCPSPPTSGNDL